MTRLATITKARIEKSIEDDQGTAYRKHLEEILPKIEDAYRESSDGFRSHLGASLIGRDCAFELFLGFRWVKKAWFPERVLRLFNRGHLEEAHFLAMIMSAQLEVWYETPEGGQFRLSDHGGHFGSALDGVVKIPELDYEPAYAEFKTHNDKSFKKLLKEGVQDSKYEHYVQMQVCMDKMNLKWAVYFAVNKNDDHIHIEIIEYNKQVSDQYLNRAGQIIFTTEAPPRISNRAGWFQCKFCDKNGICHGKEKPAINCRTCAHSEALANGGWDCALGNDIIFKESAKHGCGDHLYNPYLMPSVELIQAHPDGYLELKLESGKIIKHGNGQGLISSEELKL